MIDCRTRLWRGKCLALIDTGCNINLVYKRDYEEMELDGGEQDNLGEMKYIF